ncbi:MAG: hypothetical protein HY738_02850 [Bacteroidia bacterium]|nr:hypothetical protein [Bacteroidia bacterium]
MKPVQKITIATKDKKSRTLEALFDSGSFYNIIRKDSLPETRFANYYDEPCEFGTAAIDKKFQIIGEVSLIMEIDNRRFDDIVLISEQLSLEMIIGAKTMQGWDISIVNENGHTKIKVGRDMRDPDITTIV